MKTLRLSIKRNRLISLLSLFVVVMVVGFVFTKWHTVSGMLTPASAPQNPDLALAQNLRSALNNPQLSAEKRDAFQKKLAIVENQINASAPSNTMADNVPSNNLLPTVPVPTSPSDYNLLPPMSKIIAGSDGMVSNSEAIVVNRWEGQLGGVEKPTFYQVFAGSLPQEVDAAQGWIMVVESQPDQKHESHRVYLAPGKTGALTILKVEGTRITFSTASGAQIYFDLATHTFSS